jgi:hypothetical protein
MDEKYWGEKKAPQKLVQKPKPEEKHIAVHENKIYFYANVNRESVVELNKKVGEIESKSLTLANNLDINPPSIKILINSGGGSIAAGISTGTLHLNIVSIDEIPAVIEPPPEFINNLSVGGSISKLYPSVKLLDSNSPIFLFNSDALSLFTPA